MLLGHSSRQLTLLKKGENANISQLHRGLYSIKPSHSSCPPVTELQGLIHQPFFKPVYKILCKKVSYKKVMLRKRKSPEQLYSIINMCKVVIKIR